ncbi:unnamed protein product [Darwinula stevensoni]|uniref:Platelet-derived growth factor (PDGF) family profile domain-containing protein n=1 Tax=Darwinula stevensoni TaxID=69355 RepID=A0A7R8X4R3_9CRUS|nr:unnamed protein product [Darwinula stevensoni]CAG0883823.1 unnamed protein product [Darwinula stevensoni]
MQLVEGILLFAFLLLVHPLFSHGEEEDDEGQDQETPSFAELLLYRLDAEYVCGEPVLLSYIRSVEEVGGPMTESTRKLLTLCSKPNIGMSVQGDKPQPRGRGHGRVSFSGRSQPSSKDGKILGEKLKALEKEHAVTKLGCKPKRTIVPVVEEGNTNGSIYYPSCVQMKRCGGCCTAKNQDCVPVRGQVETVNKEVLKIDPSKKGGPEMIQVPVERHKKCRCECKVKAEDCNTQQKYDIDSCSCICRHTAPKNLCKPDLHIWDDSTCRCACKKKIKRCSTGLVWNERDCRCTQYSSRILSPQADTLRSRGSASNSSPGGNRVLDWFKFLLLLRQTGDWAHSPI